MAANKPSANAPPEWYFAYGANMLDEILVKRRGIQPLQQQTAMIPSHTLCFNAMGLPYSEPGMGGLRKVEDERRDLPVHGVACQLTAEDMARVILTEGGGIAYNTEKLQATLLHDGSSITVTTLVARHNVPRECERLPSRRYLDLLIRGAHEKGLPQSYIEQRLVAQPAFEPGLTLRYRIGKTTFECVWQRLSYWIQRGVRRFKDEDGNVPPWFLKVFDCLLWTMWFQHDYLHAPLWGRGDGL
ncbi:hypothetical protein NLU13_3991 [Sarocladium strictum]|uniref:gamma-glutamylcyclotransferase n=1 Tax=Sarocladium strictum TaxID=5046 RepID=A0AA39GIP5_SARSR|nr:hypothetical protein NLU13_3991 [Sarocladium strictum]